LTGLDGAVHRALVVGGRVFAGEEDPAFGGGDGVGEASDLAGLERRIRPEGVLVVAPIR
jgi:hypothetical protein